MWGKRPKYKGDSALADDRKHYEGIGCETTIGWTEDGGLYLTAKNSKTKKEVTLYYDENGDRV